MHDPMTVAFEIKYPWKTRGYREPLVTIWHVDPETDGTDDSCDWFNRGKAEDKASKPRLAVYEALWDMETLLDNRPHYPDSPEHKAFQPLKIAIQTVMAPKPRWWWQHPRWHFWHWKIQIHPLLKLKRWLFSKCCKCGKGFRYGESPVSGNWDSTGPRWFRSEQDVYHGDCSGSAIAAAVKHQP